MNDAAPASIYVRADDIVEAEVSGQLVLLDTRNWRYIEFNRVATAIWRLLDTPQGVDGLVTQLIARFAVEPAACERETRAFLADAVSNGFVVTRPS
jgi:hypothetical protein